MQSIKFDSFEYLLTYDENYNEIIIFLDAIEEEYDRERLLLTNGHTSLSEVISNRTLR